MFANKKAFMMFDLNRGNKVVAFIKRNPAVVMLIVGLAIGLFMPDAHADLGFLSNKLKTKINDIAKVLNTTAAAAAVVGFGWFVFTLVKGEPNYRLCGFLIVGSVLLAVSGQVATWLAH